MHNYKTIAGGACAIASGAAGVMTACFSLLAALMFGYFSIAQLPSMYTLPRDMTGVMLVVYLVIALVAAALAALSIVGGVFALRRKRWGLALAGAVAGIFTFFPTGIAAVVLLALDQAAFTPVAQGGPAEAATPHSPPAGAA
jgi:hypothetical protein